MSSSNTAIRTSVDCIDERSGGAIGSNEIRDAVDAPDLLPEDPRCAVVDKLSPVDLAESIDGGLEESWRDESWRNEDGRDPLAVGIGRI